MTLPPQNADDRPHVGGWGLAIALFGLIGGAVGWLTLKDKDRRRADHVMKWGMIWSAGSFAAWIVFILALVAILSHNLSKNLESPVALTPAHTTVAGSNEATKEPGTTTQPAAVEPLQIILPEGFTRVQMAERINTVVAIARKERNIQSALSASEYLELTKSSTYPGRFAGDGKVRTLEGFLLPATYEFLGSTTTDQLVSDQLVAFRAAWKKLDLRYARSKNLTSYDVLIIASMVEKEAFSPDERAKVAAVIYNRLHARMTLGIDATLRYGLNLKPTQSLSPFLNSSNRYNTRIHPGLPPTPIANPGLASMQAAAHPAKVKYLYFLRKPGTKHQYFTESSADFHAHERAWGYGHPPVP